MRAKERKRLLVDGTPSDRQTMILNEYLKSYSALAVAKKMGIRQQTVMTSLGGYFAHVLKKQRNEANR